ncbi:MAG: arsenic efflux protein [Acetatifactor sp.]|nr:arsenic efflux protein [Acetatifactor sp.]
MLHAVEHAAAHTIKDSLFVILILFLTYLAMEYLEHSAGGKIQLLMRRAGRLGPVVGALAGVVPQCGFSAAASNLYAGRIVTMGTLLAVYLSTSDEMLPVMISAHAPVGMIGGILLVKVLVGMTAGLLIDLLCGKRQEEHAHIHEICEQEHCGCEKGIFRSALSHTLQVGIFLLLISFVLNLVLEILGEDVLAGFLLNRPIVGPLVAGLVGFIPNCAASVAITELYLEGLIGVGSLLSGLLVGAGVGLLVLFRVNHKRSENCKIAGILYAVGVLVGITAEFVF